MQPALLERIRPWVAHEEYIFNITKSMLKSWHEHLGTNSAWYSVINPILERHTRHQRTSKASVFGLVYLPWAFGDMPNFDLPIKHRCLWLENMPGIRSSRCKISHPGIARPRMDVESCPWISDVEYFCSIAKYMYPSPCWSTIEDILWWCAPLGCRRKQTAQAWW